MVPLGEGLALLLLTLRQMEKLKQVVEQEVLMVEEWIVARLILM